MTIENNSREQSGRTVRSNRIPALRPRLAAALRMLGSCEVLADIGCDHGYFGIAAVGSGCAKRVIASDISPLSLEKAKRHTADLGIGASFDFRVSDGFDAYTPGEAESAVLLGMGGELIVSILENGRKCAQSLKRIVMQPMRGEAELRGYLLANGYNITDEAVVFDGGRYYQLISAYYAPDEVEPLPAGWPDGYYQFGPVSLLKREEAMLPMMERYLAVIERKLDKAACRGSRPEMLVREAECTKAIIALYLSMPEDQNGA